MSLRGCVRKVNLDMLSLSETDNNSRRSMRVGDVAEVTLDENPTTGYRWQLDVDQQVLRVVDDTYEPVGPMPGAAGRRTFRLEALHVGAVTIHARHLRSWQPDHVIAEFAVELEIAAP